MLLLSRCFKLQQQLLLSGPPPLRLGLALLVALDVQNLQAAPAQVARSAGHGSAEGTLWAQHTGSLAVHMHPN